MKKIIALMLVLLLAFSFVACGGNDNDADNSNDDAGNNNDNTGNNNDNTGNNNDNTGNNNDNTGNNNDNTGNNNGGNDIGDNDQAKVMTYAEYVAAEIDDEVIVDVYVQAHQSWWNDKITVYAQDEDGAYFLYDMACSKEDADKLVPGTHILVTGYKAVWAGEIEIIDATFEIIEGSYIAEATEVDLAAENLIDYQNRFVAMKGLTVVDYYDKVEGVDGDAVQGNAFAYKGGSRGDDIYFQVTDGTNVYDMCIEVYLTGTDTEVYQAVEALKIGDVIDIEGFLYWYDGVNPHVTSVSPVAAQKLGMTYAEYVAAEIDDEVIVDVYVQAHQSWWNDKITVYAQDEDGAYFLYDMACSKEDADKLVPGTHILVTGYKAVWAGEIEIIDATFEIIEGSYIAEATEVDLAAENLIDYQNRFVAMKGLTVVDYYDEAENVDGDAVQGNAFAYKGGSRGDDIYFQVTDGTNVYDMCIEVYLTGTDTEVYQAVEALQIGDVIDIEGFLYWYNGVNPHVTSVEVVE